MQSTKRNATEKIELRVSAIIENLEKQQVHGPQIFAKGDIGMVTLVEIL